MRKISTLISILAVIITATDTNAPLAPPWPEVTDTPESIRTRVGYMSRGTMYSVKSNIMAAIYQVESETSHHFKSGKRKGQIQVSSKGAIGVGQVMPYHGKSMGLDLKRLEENIQASYRVFRIFGRPYTYKYRKSPRTALLYTIQAYYGGPGNANKKYRSWKISPKKHDCRVYMWRILRAAEGRKIPWKYRFYVFQIKDRLKKGLK